MRIPVKVALVMAVGLAAMSSASILIRNAQAQHVPSLVIAAYRLGLASLALSIPAVRQQSWKDYAKLGMRTGGLLIASGVFLGLHFAAWITSLAHTSVLSSVVLVASTPLWIGLVSPLFLKETAQSVAWVGIGVAMVGGAVIGLSDLKNASMQTGWGDLLALSGAMFAAVYLMIGRRVRARLHLIAYIWIVYGVAALFLLGWVWTAGLPLTGYSADAYLWLGALALVPQLIGHSAANYGVRYLPATLVGVTTVGEPVGSSILAFVFLAELPTALQLCGGALILLGIVLVFVAGSQGAAIPESGEPNSGKPDVSLPVER